MRVRRYRPFLIPPGAPPVFPDPNLADPDGLLAGGGDLSLPRLLAAYDAGVFPWYDVGMPPLWWSPDPRTVIELDDLHVSRSLRRTLSSGRFRVTWNQAFARVMSECGRQRKGGTWIFPEMLDAYLRAHEAGAAFSLEVWAGDELAGGLYGVQRGALFAAESMFHRVTDASKVALVAAVRSFFAAGVTMFDVQFMTSHLRSLGAREIPRPEYLARLAVARDADVQLRDLILAF